MVLRRLKRSLGVQTGALQFGHTTSNGFLLHSYCITLCSGLYLDKLLWFLSQVRARYAEQYDYEAISNLLGMDKGDSIKIEDEQSGGILPNL